MNKRIPIARAKKNLGIIWFGGGGGLFIILVLQSLIGHYGDRSEEAWAWFLPMVMPTFTLMIGVFVSDAFGKSEENAEVDLFIFGLAFLLSIVYLLLISLTFFVPAVIGLPPLMTMKQSNYWLLPLQGIVSASLGAFFVNKKQ